MTKDNFKKALKEATDVCKFETWLRFYFVRDKDGVLTVELEPEVLEHIQKEYPALAGLAQEYDRQVISPEKSQTTVVTFINNTLDGTRFKPGFIPSVLNSKSFSVEMNAFNIWLSAHESQLDEKVLDFAEWMQLFEAWKMTEKGQNTLLNFTGPSAETSTNTH